MIQNGSFKNVPYIGHSVDEGQSTLDQSLTKIIAEGTSLVNKSNLIWNPKSKFGSATTNDFESLPVTVNDIKQGELTLNQTG